MQRSMQSSVFRGLARGLSSSSGAARELLHKKIETLSSAAPLTHQSFAGRKRFYKKVGVKQVDECKFGIELDGKTLRTPGRNHLHLPSYGLALSIAAEWDAQTDARTGIEPTTMPMMTLASTAIDQVLVDAAPTVQTCMKYIHTDSALFFTNEMDRILLQKQEEALLPIIRWVEATLGVQLATTKTMAHRIQHSEDSLHKIERVVAGMDHFSLACLQSAVMECKSLAIALALLGRAISLEQAKHAARLEEVFQTEIWGEVEGGHDMDRLNNSVGLSAVTTFMHLLKSDRQLRALFEPHA